MSATSASWCASTHRRAKQIKRNTTSYSFPGVDQTNDRDFFCYAKRVLNVQTRTGEKRERKEKRGNTFVQGNVQQIRTGYGFCSHCSTVQGQRGNVWFFSSTLLENVNFLLAAIDYELSPCMYFNAQWEKITNCLLDQKNLFAQQKYVLRSLQIGLIENRSGEETDFTERFLAASEERKRSGEQAEWYLVC